MNKSEVLQRTYRVFTQLERDFALTSNQSRGQFLLGRFGGDIETGSLIILTAIAGEYQTQEEVEKLSFLQDLIGRIVDNKDKLVGIQDFKFDGTSNFDRLVMALDAGRLSGSLVEVCEQSQLMAKRPKVYHYVSTPKCIRETPLQRCSFIKVYDEMMAHGLRATFGMQSNVGDIWEVHVGNALSKAGE